MDRREFLELGTAGALVGASLSLLGEKALSAAPVSEKSTPTGIFALEHKVKPLSFDPKKLKGISERLIISHWENNYTASVKTLNAVRKKLGESLAQKDTPPFLYGDLKREHLMRTGSVVLHEIYFENLGGNGKADTFIKQELSKQYGAFENWEAEFRKIAQSLAGGSGWIVLGYNLHLKVLENYWSWDHMHASASAIPILVMDMYEHAYQMDYGAQAAKYIDAFFENIDWSVAAHRLERVLKFS